MLGQDKQPTVVTISSATFLKIILLLLVIVFFWIVRDVMFLLLVSIVLAAAFDPWVDWFQKKKIPRAFSILGIYLMLLGVVSLAISLIVPLVMEQLNELIKNLPHIIEKLGYWFTSLQELSIEYGFIDNLNATVTSWQSSIGGETSGGFFSFLGGVFGGMFALFSVLVMTFYMIIEEDNTKKFVKSVCPKKYQNYSIELMDRISLRMGYWLRGQLTLSFIVGLMVYVFIAILGIFFDIKYAFILALIAAITEIIPYVGPFLGAIPGVLIGFTISPLVGFLMIVIYFVVQQIENSMLTPKIMSKASGLNPIIVIIAILVGAKLGGSIGAIISIPVAIILSIFFKDFIEYPKQYKGE